MCERMKESRVVQTKAEINRLLTTVREWKDRRTSTDNDYRGQHNSQIDAITQEINGTAKIIETEINGLDLAELSLGEIYAKCTETERRCVWLWRVFEFFRSKFDQRDDPVLEPILRAADEVVWSCYKPFFQNTGVRIEPAPLPFIGEDYSPSALRKNQMPGSLKLREDFEPLKEYLNELPIPILQLPPNIITSQWGLVLIGHEVGHFIQPLVSEDYEYDFRELLAEAVKNAGGDEIQQQYWREWSPEVFADWYSVLMMGQWALWTMAQFEFQIQEDMSEPRGGSYPSALARLHLLAHLVDAYIPNEGTRILQHYDIMLNQLNETFQTDELTKIVPAVADAIYHSCPGNLGEFKDIFNFQASDYETQGRIERYADRLIANQRPTPNRRLDTARYYASGIAQSWSKVIDDANLDFEQVNENLKESLKDIVANAPDGTRSATPGEKTKARKPLLDFIDKAVEKEKH